MSMDMQNILDLKIESLDLLDCLKKKLQANHLHTVKDLTEITKAELMNIFTAQCDEGCFINCCMMDIEFLLKDFELSLLQEEEIAEEETDAYKKLLEENEALRQEIAFLKSMIDGFGKENG